MRQRGLIFQISLSEACFRKQLVMGGVDLVTVKELLGHKSITMTY